MRPAGTTASSEPTRSARSTEWDGVGKLSPLSDSPAWNPPI